MTEFRYGRKSLEKLATCHDQLKAVGTRAIELTPIDFTIVHGFRPEHIQDVLFESGASKKRWPDSKHNHMEPNEEGVMVPCSLGIDVAPWVRSDIPWGDTHVFAVVAGVWFAAAKERGVTLRWGGDWDMDGETTDQTFMDWGHLELVL